MYNYAVTECVDSRYWYRARRACDVASYALGISDVELHFIEPDWRGEHQFQHPVDGFTWHGEVYILTDLFPRRLIEVCFHESRHCWQHQTNRYLSTIENAERDARIFVLEQSIPFDDVEADLWLAALETQQLRSIFASLKSAQLTAETKSEMLRDAYYRKPHQPRMQTHHMIEFR